jgi:hypothetical protein
VLVDAAGVQLGTLTELDMSSGNSLATAGEVWSTCLHFNGNYVDVNGKQQTLQANRLYGLKVQMYGPLAAADVALGLPRPMTEVRVQACVFGGGGQPDRGVGHRVDLLLLKLRLLSCYRVL